MRSDPEWQLFKENNKKIMDDLVSIMSTATATTDPNLDPEGWDGKGGDGESDPGTRRDENGYTAASATAVVGGKWTGVELPSEWEGKFDLFLDTVRAR